MPDVNRMMPTSPPLTDWNWAELGSAIVRAAHRAAAEHMMATAEQASAARFAEVDSLRYQPVEDQ